MVVPVQFAIPFVHVHTVFALTTSAVMVLPSNKAFKPSTWACDWLEFGVPAGAPPEVIVLMTPVLRLPVLTETEADAAVFDSVPPAEGRGPVGATVVLTSASGGTGHVRNDAGRVSAEGVSSLGLPCCQSK